MTPKELLQKTLDVLTPDNWIQYKGNPDLLHEREELGKSCMLDRMYALATKDLSGMATEAYFEAKDLLAQAAEVKTTPSEVGSLAAWNDTPGRTFEEVQTLFRKAIEL